MTYGTHYNTNRQDHGSQGPRTPRSGPRPPAPPTPTVTAERGHPPASAPDVPPGGDTSEGEENYHQQLADVRLSRTHLSPWSPGGWFVRSVLGSRKPSAPAARRPRSGWAAGSLHSSRGMRGEGPFGAQGHGPRIHCRACAPGPRLRVTPTPSVHQLLGSPRETPGQLTGPILS